MVRKRVGPCLLVGLHDARLGFALNGLPHLHGLRFERVAEIATLEQEVVHAPANDTAEFGGLLAVAR